MTIPTLRTGQPRRTDHRAPPSGTGAPACDALLHTVPIQPATRRGAVVPHCMGSPRPGVSKDIPDNHLWMGQSLSIVATLVLLKNGSLCRDHVSSPEAAHRLFEHPIRVAASFAVQRQHLNMTGGGNRIPPDASLPFWRVCSVKASVRFKLRVFSASFASGSSRTTLP